MITLANNSNNPFIVHYVYNTQVFRKSILPNSICAFRNLTTSSQIKNQQSLIGDNISIYDYINSSFVNQGNFTTGYTGTVTQTGMTFTTPYLSITTGYTFVTSAATAGTLALNTATATTVGHDVKIAYSGAAVSTTTWLNAINTTAFSGWGITVIGTGLTTYIQSGASVTLTLSANTLGSNLSTAYYIGDNVKPSEYVTYSAADL